MRSGTKERVHGALPGHAGINWPDRHGGGSRRGRGGCREHPPVLSGTEHFHLVSTSTTSNREMVIAKVARHCSSG